MSNVFSLISKGTLRDQYATKRDSVVRGEVLNKSIYLFKELVKNLFLEQ